MCLRGISGDSRPNAGGDEVHFEGRPRVEPAARRHAGDVARPLRGLQGRPRRRDPHRMGRIQNVSRAARPDLSFFFPLSRLLG